MNEQVKDKWVAALKSGKYEQGFRMLHSIDKHNKETFCCLGVLCDLYQKDRRKKKKKGLFVDKTSPRLGILYNDHGGSLPLEVMHWAGISSSVGTCGKRSLVHLNDNLCYNFNRIAEFIENNWEQL